MARKVPKGANRGPRDRQVAIYLSKEEIEILDMCAENLGFRSKTALIVYTLEDLIHGGFSGVSFLKLASRFGSLIEKSGNSNNRWDLINPLDKSPETSELKNQKEEGPND